MLNVNTLRSSILATAATLLVGAACTPAQGGDRASASSDGTSPSSTASGSAQVRRPAPGSAWVIFGADTVVAEVARTPDERAEGLMYREELPDGTGMIFVFEDMQIRSFWMQNTYVALDIAYMDASFSVVDILQMDPLTTESHAGAAPAMFALEVPQGWFASHGVKVGDRAEAVFGVQVGR